MTNDRLKRIREQVIYSINMHYKHQKRIDAINYFTSIISICVPTLILIVLESNKPLPKILCCLSILINALDKPFNWSSKSFYHRTMRFEYLTILSKLEQIELRDQDITDNSVNQEINQFFEELHKIMSKDTVIYAINTNTEFGKPS